MTKQETYQSLLPQIESLVAGGKRECYLEERTITYYE